MDEASRTATEFLESLQDAVDQLGEVGNHYTRRGTWARRSQLVLSGRPLHVHGGSAVRRFDVSVSLGLLVRGADQREYELGVEVMWDSEQWTLATDAWVESDRNQDLLREMPERVASDLHACKEHLKEAIADLLRFDDLVPAGSSGE